MLKLEQLSKTFTCPDGDTVAVDQVSLEVNEGERCILLGPPGGGKTTLLKMINRILSPTSGTVFIRDKDITESDIFELRRSIGYVVREIGLFPHMTVEENIGIVPALLGWDNDKINMRIGELMEMPGLPLATLRKHYPKTLSRAQQQRVAIARALAADPPLLLLDEPFADIDTVNRKIIQKDFLKLLRTLGKAVVFTSEDIDEAIRLGNKVAILRNGHLQQVGSPDNLLAHPANSFVADFAGNDRILKRLPLTPVPAAMDASPPRVRSEDSLEKAAALMAEHHYDNIIMVGPRGRARGVVYLSVTREKHGTCGDYHSGLKTTINLKENLRTAISVMISHDLTWLACVDDDGFYKGYLTQKSITHFLGATYQDKA